MSSLVANEVKTNTRLFSINFFIVLTIICATFSNLYNNNYLFIILAGLRANKITMKSFSCRSESTLNCRLPH